MLTTLFLRAAFTSSEIFSLMSLPGKEEQNMSFLGIPVPEKKSTNISAIALSVDLWLMKMIGSNFLS